MLCWRAALPPHFAATVFQSPDKTTGQMLCATPLTIPVTLTRERRSMTERRGAYSERGKLSTTSAAAAAASLPPPAAAAAAAAEAAAAEPPLQRRAMMSAGAGWEDSGGCLLSVQVSRQERGMQIADEWQGCCPVQLQFAGRTVQAGRCRGRLLLVS